jgi:hypothetical protein
MTLTNGRATFKVALFENCKAILGRTPGSLQQVKHIHRVGQIRIQISRDRTKFAATNVSLSFSTYTSKWGILEARRLRSKQASNKEEEPPLLASKFKFLNVGWLTPLYSTTQKCLLRNCLMVLVNDTAIIVHWGQFHQSPWNCNLNCSLWRQNKITIQKQHENDSFILLTKFLKPFKKKDPTINPPNTTRKWHSFCCEKPISTW